MRGGGEVTGWKQRETREDRHTNIQTYPVMTTTMIRMVAMTMELCLKGNWDLAPFRVFLSTVFTSNSITVN